MTVSNADRVAAFKLAGLTDRDARINALVRSVIDDENVKEQRGEGYSDLRAGIATVHCRDDIVMLVAQGTEILRCADEQNRLLRHTRNLLVILVLLAMVQIFR